MKDIIPHWKTSLISAAITAALSALILGLVIGLAEDEPPVYKSEFSQFKYSAVQTTSTSCSRIGADILGRRHGSAVDAVVAAQLCVGLVRPLDTGLGGGHLMTLYEQYQDNPKKEMVSLFAREVAPLATTPSMFPNDSQLFVGGLSVGVPGEVAGLYAAWRRYGRLPWAELVMPSVRLLEEGVPIEPYLAKLLQTEETVVRETPTLRAMFVKPDGELRNEGDTYRNDRLLNTYKILRFDATSFYQGALADDLVADIKDAGGVITKEDFSRYQARSTDPQRAALASMNLTLYTPRAPSGGPLLRYALQILDGFDLGKANLKNLDTQILADYIFIEALKFTFGEESLLRFDNVNNDPEPAADQGLSEAYLSGVRHKISRQAADNISHYGHPYTMPDEQTGHTVCVITPQGGAVALTSTINSKFGSRVVGNRTGIVLNNAMAAFSVPTVARHHPDNLLQPGKIPMSSMSPSLVLDKNDNVVYVTGATGGQRGISALLQVALDNLYYQKRLDAAVDNPRLHHQLSPDRLYHEGAFASDIRDGLRVRGQTPQSATDVIGQVTAIRNKCAYCGAHCDVIDCIQSVTDGRSDGQPGAGY